MSDRKIARIDRALEALEPQEASCRLCPRECGVDRRGNPSGICRSGVRAGVSSALLHFGEEPVLSGHHDCASDGPSRGGGSGTIFFSGCNLKCLFCQNWQISWLGQGREAGEDELADFMLGLQAQGALNINLVSPTHVLLPILRALRIAFGRGLAIPIVYNSNGYEKAAIVERLAGIVDVYLPDCKYAFSGPAGRYSGAADYFDHAAPALQEMYVQRPDLVLDGRGVAIAGTIVRHLVLPGHVPNSLAVMEWLAGAFQPPPALSLMSQYRPCFKAPDELQRELTSDEYRIVFDRARGLGFDPLFAQPAVFGPGDHLNPDFGRDEPFLWKPGRG